MMPYVHSTILQNTELIFNRYWVYDKNNRLYLHKTMESTHSSMQNALGSLAKPPLKWVIDE